MQEKVGQVEYMHIYIADDETYFTFSAGCCCSRIHANCNERVVVAAGFMQIAILSRPFCK
jgi:hypothetical protein